MNAGNETLQQIGRHLDRGIYPAVYHGGFVKPREDAIPITRGEEDHHERQTQRRPATEPWQWAAGGQGASGGSGASDQATQIVRPDLQSQYSEELSAVQKTYPRTLAWQLREGILLLTESALIEDIDRSALFLTAVPYDDRKGVKSWGFWGSLTLPGPWIGPRHTNVPDGSICAFEPRDGTWRKGDSLIELLDLYSLWAVRHLHLEHYQRWPGYQSVGFPHERILELRPDEFCGCGQSNRLYRDCCLAEDRRISSLTAAMSPITRSFTNRAVPTAVSDFLQNHADPSVIMGFV